ncbi:MAG: hypothetical protein AB7T37_05300 [Dehalococcoidia bacterium]
MRIALAIVAGLAVLVVAGVAAGAALTSSTAGGGDVPAAPATSPTAVPTTGQPRLTPGQTVCQGVLHIPSPGEPRVIPPEYTQQREVLGFAIVGGPAVPAEAFDAAVATIEEVFEDPALRQPLVDQGAYVVIAEKGQGVLELPEFRCLEKELGRAFSDHVCGIADRADYPLVTVNAADMVGDREGPCGGVNVLYHELGHLVQGWVLSSADYIEIRVLYQAALDSGAYRGAYASRNANEYFAEGTMAYFDGDPATNLDRDWLRRNDPNLLVLLEQIYGPR